VDITPQDDTTTQPISDDQELAKALAGIADEPEAPAAPAPEPAAAEGMQFEEAPAPVADPAAALPTPTAVPISVTPAPSGLDDIKKNALDELRPLIDHVDLPAEERFDTYLMLIRSTDDTTLIDPAYAAAHAIVDEKRRAQALLDIIKEIDFLSHPQQ
jgi:hypothetical protein